MEKYKTINDYFNKNDIVSDDENIFRGYCAKKYCISKDAVNFETDYSESSTKVAIIEDYDGFLVLERVYLQYTDREGEIKRVHFNEYHLEPLSEDGDWFPGVYYSLIK